MIISTSRNELVNNVAMLQNAVAKKGTISILYNILIKTNKDSIILTATDLEIGIKIEMPAEIIEDGSITLPAKKFYEMIKEITDDVINIKIAENKWANISTSSGIYKICGTDSEEYPSIPEPTNNIFSSIPCDIFSEAIDKILFSIAQENDNQFNLVGVLFEIEKTDNINIFKLVSSDGHRMSLFEKEIDTDVSKIQPNNIILIPKKGIIEAKKLCEANDFIEMGFENKQVIFKSERYTIFVKLLTGEFPNYKNIFKSVNKTNCIYIDRLNLISSLKRINIFTEDIYNSVSFLFKKDKLILSSQNIDIGSANEELPITKDNDEELSLGFNGKYFIESVQVMNSDTIKIYITNERSPCLIEGDDDQGFMSIIMPMQI
ncbi:MAG: DNA polymerase III subunit beta [Desulfobacteraceae bacterium]|nr:DNA polymerase III subunit beta [Desulfobacteraceae bacterium]